MKKNIQILDSHSEDGDGNDSMQVGNSDSEVEEDKSSLMEGDGRGDAGGELEKSEVEDDDGEVGERGDKMEEGEGELEFWKILG